MKNYIHPILAIFSSVGLIAGAVFNSETTILVSAGVLFGAAIINVFMKR